MDRGEATMGTPTELTGPDLKQGVRDAEVREGVPLLGHIDGQPAILVRDRGCVHAVGAKCTHYGGPLAEGIVDGGAIHCPWHHACFDLDTGRAHGPALDAISCWDVQLENGTLLVGSKREPKPAELREPKSVVIVGGGAAGVACAEALRAEGCRGTITIVASEGSDPVDRPNLSKDYLAGSAPEEWVYLRTADALAAHDIALVADAATAIDRSARVVRTASGRELAWDALLVATGAEPNRLPIDGADQPHVRVLRTLGDSRAIIAAASPSQPVVVIGASFIGLEVAASLRTRGVGVTVVEPEDLPLARVLGNDVGAFVRRIHEGKGVAFRTGRKPARIDRDRVILDDGGGLPAALIVMGVGVRPRTELAAAAGLKIDRGVVVDGELRAAPGVWAAGDIARYPWRGELVRIEHWQVATRHGQAVARAMLGRGVVPDVPFFWSQHYDIRIAYVGHAERFERAEVRGDLDARDAHVAYYDGGRVRAVATIGRDRLALQVEAAMARDDDAAVLTLVA
jgi:NADPH-dependent 2,4-dienoyl-CoA reductase/sulfur reductase-like enzyme/nitrite reductase/ring-hydroxylating ferredoxin subunit